MKKKHISALNPAILLVNIFVSVIGAIVGLELIARLGISTNTSIIGALFAIIISRLPLKFLKVFREFDGQNMVQTSMSGATFAASNGIFLSICVPFVLGRQDLVLPMFFGATMAVLCDITILYKTFDSQMFPATGTWAPGIASAEAIKAVADKGKNAVILVVGTVAGVVGKMFGIPMDILGVAWIGNIFALAAFGVGLVIAEYAPNYLGYSLSDVYIPHGVMIGAGAVALIQMAIQLFKKGDKNTEKIENANGYQCTCSNRNMRLSLGKGFAAYVIVALIVAVVSGFITEMSPVKFGLWVIFAAFSAIASELLVGISAMHSGWFPAFATAFIFLIIGMLMGFPPTALAILAGYTSATGPAFADMAYDLKAGFILRGEGADMEYELEGRKQQYICEVVGVLAAVVVVFLTYNTYFNQDLLAPVSRVFVATIDAGADIEIAKNLLIWAVPGAIIQAIGGSEKQLGTLLATGLLIPSKFAGITVIAGVIIRMIVVKMKGEQGQKTLYILGAGSITGAALYSFFTSTTALINKKK